MMLLIIFSCRYLSHNNISSLLLYFIIIIFMNEGLITIAVVVNNKYNFKYGNNNDQLAIIIKS